MISESQDYIDFFSQNDSKFNTGQGLSQQGISSQSYNNETSIEQHENYTTYNNTNDNQTDEKENTQQLMRRCDFKNIEFMYKFPKEDTIFLMYGDLLIETSKMENNLDYSLKVCDKFMQKKKIANVIYDKTNGVIESYLVNQQSGNTNFQYVKQRLINSQDILNYKVAQQLDFYEKNINDIRLNYTRFFAENDEEIIYQCQKDFVDSMTRDINQEMKENDADFYQYLFHSFIDKHDIGHPVQIKQGVCEATCMLFGLDPLQISELMNRHGLIEHVLLKGFQHQNPNSEVETRVLFMSNVEYFTQLRDLFNSRVTLVTVDGIQFSTHLIVKQRSQTYNGVTITCVYTSQFLIDADEIQRIIQIRQDNKNQFNPNDQTFLLLNNNNNNQIQKAEQFLEYLNNPKNFRPKTIQDQYPEKTCKYRQVQSHTQTSFKR